MFKSLFRLILLCPVFLFMGLAITFTTDSEVVAFEFATKKRQKKKLSEKDILLKHIQSCFNKECEN